MILQPISYWGNNFEWILLINWYQIKLLQSKINGIFILMSWERDSYAILDIFSVIFYQFTTYYFSYSIVNEQVYCSLD